MYYITDGRVYVSVKVGIIDAVPSGIIICNDIAERTR